MSRCRSCDAPIVWRKTEAGKAMPLDPTASRSGNVQLLPGGACRVVAGEERDEMLAKGQTLYLPHHSTCPQGREWKRP